MRLNLFGEGDVILLLGEGNFSFAACLCSHHLLIEMVATCFEPEIEYDNQQAYIDYLEGHKVPVFLDVDATKVHEHPHVSARQYTKIIFNFPHVGGKMKIQLNRELLKKTFESVRHILAEDGLMIMSLCRGQGGTPADEPRRRWDDSWQVTEMAAHGDFVLVAVEPFEEDNFPDYQCVGYRSQDMKFNLDGALVHIFSKRNPPYKSMDGNEVKQRLGLTPLEGNNSVSVPVLYSDLYFENPLKNPHSPVSYFKKLFEIEIEKCVASFKKNVLIKALTDRDMPLYVSNERGVICKVDDLSNGYKLRLSSLQILNKAVAILEEIDIHNGLVFFPGMYFNPLTGKDFLTDPPITFQFLLLGKSASTYGYRYIYSLPKTFAKSNLSCSLRPQNATASNMPHPSETIECLNSTTNVFEGKLATEWVYTDSDDKEQIVSHVYSLIYKETTIDACIIYPDKLAQVFFGVQTWRELWADRSEVVETEDGPALKQAMLYPKTYEFDVTLRYSITHGLYENTVYQILWLSAGHIIEKAELLSEHHSSKGWSSKCYRITYKSLDKPLHRNRVIQIHANVVSKMLASALKVTIS